MAHKSEKGSWSKTANVGCMWGLINMFNFRRFTSRRFLVSQNRRSGRHPSGRWHPRRRMKLLTNSEGKSEQLATVDADERKNGDMATESVKNLINKEMSSSKLIQKNSNVERRQIIDKSGECLDKNHSPSDKALEVDGTRNMNETSSQRIVGSYQSLFQNVTERISKNFDLDVLVNDMEGGRRNHFNLHQSSEKDFGIYLSVERQNSVILPFLDQVNGEASKGLLILQQMLCETLEGNLRDKFPGAVRTCPEDVSHTSEELRCSLEMSAHYKELFLDALVRVLQNPVNIQCGMSNIKPLANDMDNSKKQISSCFPNDSEKNLMNELSCGLPTTVNSKSQSSSRIVILKPNPKKTKNASSSSGPSAQAYSSGLQLKEENGKLKSHLFFHDVKKRLAHLLGDESKDISQDVETENLMSSGRSRQASNNIVKASELEKQKAFSPQIGYEVGSVKNHRCNNDTTLETASSSFCKESDILSAYRKTEAGDGSANSEKKGSRSLRKLLSLPADYMADIRYCSEKDAVGPLSPQHMKSHSWSSEQDIDLKLASQTSCNSDGAPQMTDSSTGLSNIGAEEISSEDISSLEGLRKRGANESPIVEKSSAVMGDVTKEVGNHTVTTPESFPSPPFGIINLQDPLEEKSHLLCPSSATMLDALLVHSPEVNESIGEKQERPSPVSVLEMSAIDDIRRPESTFTINESYPKFKVVPRHIYFEDDDSAGFLPKISPQTHLSSCMEDEKFKYGYVKSLLEAAGLSSYPLPIKSQLSHPLLDPSLYDEVETPSEEIPDDLKLFFDCVVDVVEEIYERSSSSKPWVYFAKPELRSFPYGEKLIEEVLRGLNCLYVLCSPKSFEEIVKRELESGPWMDIRSAVEDFVLEVGHAILDKLLEETMLEIWD